MTKNQPKPAASGLNLADIYHTLFRHKWKILLVWILGLSATFALWRMWPVKYQSDAEILIRYVLDNQTMSPVGNDSSIQRPSEGGGSIINTEAQILGSFDLDKQVADIIGPDRILAKLGGGTNRLAAAGVIHSGLTVEAPLNGGAIIHLTFKHPDPMIVQPVLDELIACYLKRHVEIHQPGSLDRALNQETDELRNELQQTEADLRSAKRKAGILSLADSQTAYTRQLSQIRENLFEAQAELAERQAALGILTNQSTPTASTNQALPAPSPVPSDKLADYRRVCSVLQTLEAQERQRLVQYTAESQPVRDIQRQIEDNQKTKDQLEKEYPQLAVASAVAETASSGQDAAVRLDPVTQLARVREIQSKIKVLNNQLDEVQRQIAAVNDVEGTITDLQRKRDVLQQKYQHFETTLDNARFDQSLGSGRISNITTVEQPTPPGKDTKKLYKALAGLLAVTFGGGLALAFVIELYLDRSFKRPTEIETSLGRPLFLSIPRARINGKHRPLIGAGTQKLIGDRSNQQRNGSNGAPPDLSPAPSSDKGETTLRSYIDTLRDRLMLYFEMRNVVHKPKLVAVTSCAEGSGVSTIASGLAASLSKTGEGNVLLVDMNDVERGSAQFFHKGELACGLDDALQTEKRENAMVEDRLYVVSDKTSDGKLPQILHKRYASLLPKLRASDYDYIIFDMPPVSQISPTTRLAKFMDIMFMVVEAEKTDRDVVKRATDMLGESTPNIGVVLNKWHKYVPGRLQQEL